MASNSGVGDVSQIDGVANPSNGDFGLKNAFWNIGRASSVAACALVISGTALRSLPLRRAYFRAIMWLRPFGWLGRRNPKYWKIRPFIAISIQQSNTRGVESMCSIVSTVGGFYTIDRLQLVSSSRRLWLFHNLGCYTVKWDLHPSER